MSIIIIVITKVAMALYLELSYHLTTSHILDTETHNDAVSGTCK